MLKPIKSLGQNYLKDKNILRKITEAIEINSEDLILEIGPGTGALTEFILNSNPRKLIAVDIDNRTKVILEQKFKDYLHRNFEIINSDIREFNITDSFNLTNNQKIKVCGNIPYYLTASILFYLIENKHHINTAVLMMQKEVAQRIISKSNTKNYGILSVILQLCSNVEVLFDVSPNCFYPKPKVTSSVLKLKFLSDFQIENFNDFIQFVKRIFNKRRKIIKNNLDKDLKTLDFDNIQNSSFETFLYKRAEELNPSEIYELFKEFTKIKLNESNEKDS